MTGLVSVGIDHRSAPARTLAHAGAWTTAAWIDRWRELDAAELAVLLTCNRFEIYAVGVETTVLERAFLDALDLAEPPEALHVRAGHDAVRHLFSVAAGLESMVVGEDEIQHQVRRSLKVARESGTLGPVLDALFRGAVAAGRSVRGRTGLGAAQRSLAEVAVRAGLAASPMATPAVLVVGTGAIASAVLRRLAARGLAPSVVARSADRAAQVAPAGGRIFPVSGLAAAIEGADVVISGTSASTPPVTLEIARAALRGRADRVLVVIDLAATHDVDPAVGRLPGVALIDLERLGALDAPAAERFGRELRDGSAIVDAEASRFSDWLERREQSARLAKIREDVRRHAVEELGRLLQPHGELAPEKAEAILVRAIARGFHAALAPSTGTSPLEIRHDLTA